jgi:hypothetical protein
MEQKPVTDFILDRRAGKVSLPEAGEGAYLQFTMEAYGILETAYGEDYISVVTKGLARVRKGVYEKVIACTLKGSTNGEISSYGMTIEALNIRILDALNLAVYGRTYEEQQKHDEEMLAKKFKDLEENPQTAAILSMMSASQPEPEQA